MAQIEIPQYRRNGNAKDEASKKETAKKSGAMRLKKEDYIAGLMIFLLARAQMVGEMSPFATAFFCATYTKKRIPLTLLCALIGHLSVGMGMGAFKFLLAMLLCVFAKAVLEKFGKAKGTINPLIAGGALLAGGVIHMLFGMVLAYNVALLVVESVICMLMVFVFGETKMLNGNEAVKGRISNEQLLSLFITLALAVIGLQKITQIGFVNISETICAAAVVFAAYARGMSVGACVGACAGIICSMSSVDMLPVVGIYTLCGFVAGCASNAGRFATAAAFAAGAISLGFMTTAYIYGNVGIFNFILGAAIVCLCPSEKIDRLKLLTDGYYSSRSDKVYIERLQEIMSAKLGALSSAFVSLADSFDELSEQNEDAGKVSLAQVFDSAAEKICGNCGLGGHCWEKDIDITRSMMNVAGKKLNEKGYADVLDLPQEFRDKCVHAQELVAAVNHFYELRRINALWAGQLDETRQVLSKQYKGFSEVIGLISEEILCDIACESKYEKRITEALAKKKLALKSVCVFERADESFEVEAELFEKEDLKSAEEICEAVSEALNQPMRMTNTLSDDLRIVLEPLLKYKMVSGVATIKKDGQQRNGDTYCAVSLGDNRYAIAISDGMGSGEAAARESEVVIKLIKKLLLAGFDKMAALQLINSALVLKNGDEAFATLDLAIVELVTGEAEFIKIGAATGYIKRSESVESIFCSSLPAGILTEADVQLSKKRISDGDCIVMVSDGVANAQKNTNWVCEALMGIEDDDVEAIAEIILKEAVIHRRGKVDDDMTVIAAKILEK